MNRIIVFSVLTITLLFSGTSVLIQSANAGPLWWDTDWQYRKTITIDHTKVNRDLTNFPVLIYLNADAGLSARAQTDGDDIAFTDLNQQQLDHEIEYYDGAGTLYAWVRIPFLSNSSDTNIYMYYGNSAATSQQNPASVWDSDFKMVHHLSETIDSHQDSTSNDNVGLVMGGVNQGTSGVIDGVDDFDGSSGYVDFGSKPSLEINDTITFEAWIRPDVLPSGEYWNLLIRTYPTYGLFVPYQFYLLDGGNLGFANTTTITDSGESVTAGVWNHIAVTVEQSSKTIRFYIDGSLVASEAGEFGNDHPDANVILASFSSAHYFNGRIDEVRISNKVREPWWINTCYENQNDPSSFISVGTQDWVQNYIDTITIYAAPTFVGPMELRINGSDYDAPAVNDWLRGSNQTLELLEVQISAGERYTYHSWSDDISATNPRTYNVDGDAGLTGNYVRQFYLTLISDYGTTSGEGWYNSGSDADFSVTSPIDFPNGTRYYCTGFTGSEDTNMTSGTITMNNPETITFFWDVIYLNSTIIIDSDKYVSGKEVRVDSIEYDTPRIFSWTNGTTHSIEALSPLEGNTGVRYIWDYWSNGGPQNQTYITPYDNNETLIANYNTQFFLTVNSEFDAPQGQGWYDEGDTAMFNVTSPVEVNGTRYTCTGFEGDASGTSTSGSITMDGAKTITFLWDATEYYLTVNSMYGTTHGEGWYSPGDTPEFYVTPEFVEEVNGTRHVFQGWTGDYIDGANPAGANQILMDGAKTVTAVWRDRFFIEIISPYGSPKGSSWPFKGENFEVSVTSPDSGYVVTGFELDGGSLEPGAKYMFVNVQEPHTIQFFWEILTETTVYTLTCGTNPPSKGTIVVGTTVYNDGESLTTIPGIYNIQANPDDDYSFSRWQTSGGVSVASSGSSTTTVTLAGDGTLTMIQQKLGVAPPPGVWGGPETQFQCIIATAAYGGTMAPEVVHMRNVRDNMIGSTHIGSVLVSGFNTFYYSWSPPVAQWIAGSEGLRTTFRVLLLPISAAVHSAELTYTTVSPFSATMASVTAFLLAAAIAIGTYIIAPIFAGLTIYRKKYASHI